MNYLPLPIVVFFLGVTALALFLFGRAVRGSKSAIVVSVAWMVLQSAVALSGFYLFTNTVPPHFILAVAPPIILIAGLFLTQAGRSFVDRMDLKWCILVHTIRIFVEVTLYWLFLYKQVPALMTFEAGNLDILAGLTVPFVWWAFNTGKIGRRGLFIWNALGLLSVLNALGRAMLSAPFRFQRFAFDQPTFAILHFPFVLLPAFIVPAVLLCHFAVFRKLTSPMSLPQ
jgi:4-amino-4-deoxy-L-arabinose transferase-like glycosyltransferase